MLWSGVGRKKRGKKSIYRNDRPGAMLFDLGAGRERVAKRGRATRRTFVIQKRVGWDVDSL